MNMKSSLKTTIPVLIVLTALMAGCKEKPQDLQGAAITALKGKVDVTNAKGEKKSLSAAVLYTKDAFVMPGYIVETGDDSTADLQFTSGAQLRLGPSSQIKLETARILTGKNFTQVQLSLQNGKLYAKTGKLENGSRFTVVGPTSIASVRGTDFMVKEENGKSATLVKEGSVEVNDKEFKKSEVVEPDKKALVDEKGNIQIKPQDESDKKEINGMGTDIASITENGRKEMQNIIKTFEEQKALIKQSLDVQKQINEQTIGDQKEKDKGRIEDQKKRDREMLQEQIRKDREMMDKIRGDATRAKDEVMTKSKEETDKITTGGKKDIDNIKKSPADSQDKTKSELDNLRKLPKQELPKQELPKQ